MLKQIEELVKSIVSRAQILFPPQVEFGHVSTNALIIDPSKRQNILGGLERLDFVEKIEVVATGFLNVFLKPSYFSGVQWEDYKLEKLKVNVEYCSPNPTGPLHLGHARATLWGSAIVRILKDLGQDATGEMYINDCGNQIHECMESIKYHQGRSENLYYKGEYIKEMAEELPFDFKKGDFMAIQLRKIRETLALMNVKHEETSFESLESDKYLETVLEILKPQTVFESFQNQKSQGEVLSLKILEDYLVLRKSDGQPTYFANDIAYARSKQRRGYEEQILCLGEDHMGHIKKLLEVAKILHVKIRVVTLSMIHLLVDNKPVTMSKRSGEFLSLQQILEQYNFEDLLTLVFHKNATKTISFQNGHVLNEHPSFLFNYLLERLKDVKDLDVMILENPREHLIFQYIVFAPKFLHEAGKNLNPHVLFDIAYKLALELHSLMSSNTNQELHRKGKLLYNARKVLENYLGLLGYGRNRS